MLQEENNILTKIFIYVAMGIILFFLASFFSLYYLPAYLDRMSLRAKTFNQNCTNLSGKEYKKDDLLNLLGFCFESCGEGCSHAVICTKQHLESFESNKSLTITQKPGAPDGWYCNVTLDEDSTLFSKSEYMLD